MRLFFIGPRMLGGLLRPGISVSGRDIKHFAADIGAMPKATAAQIKGSFVYVIRGAQNHHKIGISTDPIQRLASLQTGCHEPLDFAYVGVTPGTGLDIEQAAHGILAQYRQSGEWFAVPASIAIGAVIEAASRCGEPIQQVQPAQVPQILAIARAEQRQASAPGKHCGAFNPFPWYIRWPATGVILAIVVITTSFAVWLAVTILRAGTG